MATIPPELFKNIRRIEIYTTRTVNDILAGAYHSAFKGRGMEFEDVREYQPGDEVRSIDWNVTARFNHPYVKSYREERELTVMLLVDVSASSRFGTRQRLKSELIAEIGAVLAFSAIKNNDKIGLILFSSTIEKYIPPNKGTRHVLRVIRELLAFKPQYEGTDVSAALHFLGKVQRKQGVCFVISDFISPNYSQEATLCAKRHDLITIAVTDPVEQSFPNMGMVSIRDLETGKLSLVDTSDKEVRKIFTQRSFERLQKHQQLMGKIGAGFIDIRTDKDYAYAIRSFFKLREKRR